MKLKDLIWVGQSKKALMDLPEEVKKTMGYGLYIAQNGDMPENAKVLKGFGGAGVSEIIDSDQSGTYRAVYTIKMADIVFVLHVFQKKSKHGITTPQKDIDLIHSRLKMAEEIYRERLHHEKNKNYSISSGNVFADLELPNPGELLAKAELARQINVIIQQRNYTQDDAADRLGIDQPKISALSTGKLSGFSLERLFKFLNMLDQTITIKVSPRTKLHKKADVIVAVSKTKKAPLIKQPSSSSRSVHARKKR